jgi:soluble lytic murein transglycosylase
MLPRIALAAAVAIAFLPSIAPQAEAGTATGVEEQRRLFREAYGEAEKGDWGPAAAAEAALSDYPLWPDLREAWLRANIRKMPAEDIEAFLERHAELPTADRLRGRWIHELARRGDWQRFLAQYDSHYAAAGVTRLDCMAAHARRLADPSFRYDDEVVERLWLAGHSQPDECDPVFERLRAEGLLTTERYRQRFRLAIEARQFRLARYLARDLDDEARAEAAGWIAMQDDPAAELVRILAGTVDGAGIDRVLWGIRALARQEPAYAADLWPRLTERLDIPPAERVDAAGYIAIRAALRREPTAAVLLKSLPTDAVSVDVLAWRTRNALIRSDWADALTAIGAMPDDMQSEEIWRYWRARALAAMGDETSADEIYAGLARERSYHGFLAADALGLPYAFGDERIAVDEDVVRALAADPAIRRAGELFRVGLESRGRSEWGAAIAGFDPSRLTQAAILAHRWGWHSRAIAAAARAGYYDDLQLRYPLPWKESFEAHAADADIREAWALGIARSESLFMADVRSRAGAIGVMQLMPDTGRSTARTENLPWLGYATLIDPAANIQLGTRYLAQVYHRFSANPVLATAAYNAGPHRVERWLPESAGLPADIWIETIPFFETRAYVKRVLTADTIFSWRLTGRETRLSALHLPIPATSERVAMSAAGEPAR